VPTRTLTSAEALRLAPWLDPAAIRGEKAGRATDLWSLGLLLLHALTGRHSSVPATTPQRAVLHALRTPPNASAGLAPAEAALIRACLEPDPGRRPPTAADLADRMEALAAALQARRAAPPGPGPMGPPAAAPAPTAAPAAAATPGAQPFPPGPSVDAGRPPGPPGPPAPPRPDPVWAAPPGAPTPPTQPTQPSDPRTAPNPGPAEPDRPERILLDDSGPRSGASASSADRSPS